MSYSGNESLKTIIKELRYLLNKDGGLKNMLNNNIEVETLHGTVEMLSSLIMKYERKEIIDLKSKK
tara:strand:- start:691 stop:888 length:198 start_codon:yes stop_codon:yes gene_type:complete